MNIKFNEMHTNYKVLKIKSNGGTYHFTRVVHEYISTLYNCSQNIGNLFKYLSIQSIYRVNLLS